MLDEKRIERILQKMKRFERTLQPMLFDKIDSVEMKSCQTTESLQTPPEGSTPCNDGDNWGGEGVYNWFTGTYRVPAEYEGKALYICPKTGGNESLLFVNGMPFGILTAQRNRHGMITGHYCALLKMNAVAGEDIDIALEAYAGHYIIGTQPFDKSERGSFNHTYHGVDICLRNDELIDFYFDLRTLNEAVEALDRASYRRADIINALMYVHSVIYYSPEDVSKDKFLGAIREASTVLKEKLKNTNSATAPFAGLTGHSHMDTAWLWHIGETVKKCARTFSNQLALMEQYDEHRFIQSSAYHSEMILENYPSLFDEIKKRVAEGRYEPNGAVWIECDCNITGGEYMVRQFVWGQRFTKKHFNYISDTFWLPDTFGYSAAIPQIMIGCGVKYFVTTKLSWNDSSNFPYDSFYWKGVDGTSVLTHFPKSHDWPCPKTLMRFMHSADKRGDVVKDNRVSNMKLLCYGYGDGGGGPQFEMLEMARRIRDFEGLPRTAFMPVSAFMQKLEKDIKHAPVYSGELYLELHRGTLTNQHQIKRNNRLAEISLHNLEFVTVQKALEGQVNASNEDINPLTKTLLVNQFHDILPGTSIPCVHEECKRDVGGVIERANALTNALLQNSAPQDSNTVTITNTLSFDRTDVIYIKAPKTQVAKNVPAQQHTQNINGDDLLAISGVCVPAFGSVTIELTDGAIAEEQGVSAFSLDGNTLKTPFAEIEFDDKGAFTSFTDTRCNRPLCGEGYPLNTFLIAEDVPLSWDNWDIDEDIALKYRDDALLTSRTVISCGSVELRIRSVYSLAEKSTLTQDTIFFADSAEVRFETLVDWNDDHRFLKAAFDTNIFTDTCRHEIQFGYIKRLTSSNTLEEKAKFEVSNHKYSDLSENGYGVAILNDCKYGISAKDGSLRLSLHKGGNRPDYNGDKGLHEFTYSFLPHEGGFSADTVIRPAYTLNYKPLQTPLNAPTPPLLAIDKHNVIAETVKPCEDAQRAYIIRLYEAEGTYTNAVLTLNHTITAVDSVNMLEEDASPLPATPAVPLTFRPFEIKTIKVSY